MKRLVTAIIFLLASVAICLTGYAICLSKLNNINDALGKATYVAKTQDKEGTLSCAKVIEKEWEKSSRVLYVLLLHTDINEIDKNIKMLDFFARSEDFDEFEKVCQESIVISNRIITNQKATIENIL